MLAEQGRADEAIARYERALAVKPDYVEAHINLGKVLRSGGRLEDAIAHYARPHWWSGTDEIRLARAARAFDCDLELQRTRDPVKAHALLKEPPKKDRVESWKQEMSAADVAEFEEIAGDLLRELGYETSTSAAPLAS